MHDKMVVPVAQVKINISTLNYQDYKNIKLAYLSLEIKMIFCSF